MDREERPLNRVEGSVGGSQGRARKNSPYLLRRLG